MIFQNVTVIVKNLIFMLCALFNKDVNGGSKCGRNPSIVENLVVIGVKHCKIVM